MNTLTNKFLVTYRNNRSKVGNSFKMAIETNKWTSVVWSKMLPHYNNLFSNDRTIYFYKNFSKDQGGNL